jgi:hypothetical protein
LYAAILDRCSVVNIQIGQYDAAHAANGETRENDRSEPRRHPPIPPDQFGLNGNLSRPSRQCSQCRQLRVKKWLETRSDDGAEVSHFCGDVCDLIAWAAKSDIGRPNPNG